MSSLTNCVLVVRHAEAADYLFYFPDPKTEQSGDAYISLNGYLICPLDMFSARQLKMAQKKYARLASSATTH